MACACSTSSTLMGLVFTAFHPHARPKTRNDAKPPQTLSRRDIRDYNASNSNIRFFEHWNINRRRKRSPLAVGCQNPQTDTEDYHGRNSHISRTFHFRRSFRRWPDVLHRPLARRKPALPRGSAKPPKSRSHRPHPRPFRPHRRRHGRIRPGRMPGGGPL